MNTKKIVITGGPGTGKSSIIDELKERGHICFDEISRQVTLEARKSGVDQLFLTQPLLFSQMLLEGRAKQFVEANNQSNSTVFLDRGLPDVLAYMDYFGSAYPEDFVDVCQNNTYEAVFILAPWKEIFKCDSVRYETFEQAERIHEQLLKTYKKFNYNLIDIPFDTVAKRTDFIIESLNL
ncbi:AAA family ATPase [Gelidibacter salicanalis]|uniref:ATP-binding protein n=1 Tax=Gelidibacter salicanalis TaxID=291193 RepID=A0A934KJ67_9FLAO|nr:ATP-binding protein [Gelidibacter salicanalis]MBJ7880012.1 ATP-binding protein [Gelidibacter salicanalis]